MVLHTRLGFLELTLPDCNSYTMNPLFDIPPTPYYLAWGKYDWYSLGGRVALNLMVWYQTGSTVWRRRRSLWSSVLYVYSAAVTQQQRSHSSSGRTAANRIRQHSQTNQVV